VAAVRGDYWRLTDAARDRLGEKLGRLAARYVPKLAKYSLEADVLVTLASELRPRVQVEVGAMTIEELKTLLAERDNAGGSVFSKVANAVATPPAP